MASDNSDTHLEEKLLNDYLRDSSIPLWLILSEKFMSKTENSDKERKRVITVHSMTQEKFRRHFRMTKSETPSAS